jgi:PqqD family protein of HPr-rel-A system
MKWRSNSIGRFYDSDEGTVVYFDPHSGDTHLLSEFAAHIMRQLGDQLLTIDELVTQILPSIDFEDLRDLEAAVPNVLAELVDLDILKQE